MGNSVDAAKLAEWKSFQADILKLRKSALQAIIEAFPDLSRAQAAVRFQESVFRQNFLKSIQEKFSNTATRDQSNKSTYIAYHILNGSNQITIEEAPNLDFPGDLSIGKFYQNIIDNPRIITIDGNKSHPKGGLIL
jgi:hypothetical protein